jgi:copper chaperone CopZ
MSLCSPVAVAAALALSAAACKGGSSELASVSPSATSLANATFDVAGMTCTSCNIAVKLAAERVLGVSEARASHDEKRAWVTYDPAKTTPAAIAIAITHVGYKATPVQN